ncbi:MAG: IS30 family transposase [Nitrospiria bacterium]
MVKYYRLTLEERYQIEALLTSGMSLRGIARQLKRSPSTLSREVRKLGCPYEAFSSDQRTQDLRRTLHPELRKIQGALEDYVREKIGQDWSPEQIAGWLRHKKNGKLSHQTIYRYLRRDKAKKGSLCKHLRILSRPKQRPKALRKPTALGERTMIDQRPSVVEERNRLGDYERDTMMGKWNGPFLLTMVDRTSRYAKIAWVKRKCSVLVHRATVKHLREEPVKTITNDNGSEFSKHKRTARALKAKVYFSQPYHSWERGTNENFNGLLRQYFPRRMDLSEVTSEELKSVEDLLNNRPRKCLGFKTPFEVQEQLKRQVLR